MTRAVLIKGVLLALAFYVLAAVIARLVAARALHYPELASRRAPDAVQKIRGDDGNEIAFLHLPNPCARFTIWFFHGNAEDRGDREPWLRVLRNAGYSVFAFDYPGYGLSGGTPSEPAIYAAARTVRGYLRDQLEVAPADTLLYGRSIGGGPAVQMATEESVGGLVLQSTFTSVYRVLTGSRILPFDYFENERKLARVSCPILIMHGTRDEVIPFSHGKALLAAAREPKRSLWVEGAAHNDFLNVAGRSHWDALRDFSEFCAQRIDA
jgi:fermentation-respiration switch protein FrsA (DUF1100 family)